MIFVGGARMTQAPLRRPITASLRCSSFSEWLSVHSTDRTADGLRQLHTVECGVWTDRMQNARLLFLSVEELCTTKTCVTAAGAILKSMDDAVNPCDNFYQFACGGWIKSNPIPAGESRWSTFSFLRKQNELVIKNVLGERQFYSLRDYTH